jgi:ribosomal protein S18 acetylase RimI-like enzyme
VTANDDLMTILADEVARFADGFGPGGVILWSESDAEPGHEWTLKYEQTPGGSHLVRAVYDCFTPVGGLVWDDIDGEVLAVAVHPGYRRQGIATALWAEANRLADGPADLINGEQIPVPVHSDDRTVDSDAWVASL